MPANSWEETGKQGRHGCVRVSANGRVVCLLGATLLVMGVAQACDIPVYHYTIQMWQRDAYHVYCFYRGTEETAATSVNQYLGRSAQGIQGHANLIFTRVNVNKLDSVEYTDQDRQIWMRHQSRPLPLYVILTPRWTELFVGSLELDAARALIDSPKRRQIAEQLWQGKHGLLLLLLGPNETENATAQETVRGVLAEVEARDTEIGLVEVARDDAQEQWLVQQLLRLEDDLADLDSTMIFPVFGRGHVLEPYLGKGITKENLLEIVAFMGGPCSCEVKASSAGMDLLTNYDWQTQVANWPQPAEAPLPSLLFDIPTGADTEAGASAPVPGADAEGQKKSPRADQPSGDAKLVTSAPAYQEEGHSSPGPHVERGQEPESQTQERDGESTSAAQPLPNATAPVGSHQLHQVEPDRTGLSPQRTSDLQIEESPSLGSLLSERLGVALTTAMLLVVAVGFAIIWRRRER